MYVEAWSYLGEVFAIGLNVLQQAAPDAAVC